MLVFCTPGVTSCLTYQEQQISEAEVEVFSVPSYACQRRTTLDNHNAVLTVRPPADSDLVYITPTQRWHQM